MGKDALGHGSNPGRGNARQDQTIRNKAVDARRYGSSAYMTEQQRNAISSGGGLPQPRPTPVPIGQSANAAQDALMAHRLGYGAASGGIHATAGRGKLS